MRTSLRTALRSLLIALPVLLCATPALAQSRRIDPQNLYHYWILLNTTVKTSTPASGLNLNAPGCAAVTYMIGSDGVPRNVKLAKLVPKSDLGATAVEAVTNFRYGPSLTNRAGNPIDTYYVIPFNAPDDKAGQAKVMAPCKLAGYGN